MKKFLAILLAAMLVLSMTAVAFADELYTDEATKTFTKTYTKEGSTAVSPEETFSIENVNFEGATETGVDYDETWAASNLPTFNTVTYQAGWAGDADNMTQTFTVTLPSDYPSVGIYSYSFNEVDNNVAGVTYNSTKMILKVTVVEDGTQKRIAAVHCEGASGTKTGDFVNTYSAGTLSVQKTVTGNLGDRNKEFEVTVTFTAPAGKSVNAPIYYADGTTVAVDTSAWKATEGIVTATAVITLKHDETVTFTNIPYGVTYNVVESDYTGENGGYADPVYDFSDETNKKIDSEADTVQITNNKGADIDTGITVDSLPYVLLMGIVLLAGAAMIIKRRAHNN